MAKTFKSISEFKKNLAVGDSVHCYNHIQKKDMGIRKVSIVQTNSFALATPQAGSNEVKDSWCDYPKASMVKIEDNVLTVLIKTNPSGELIPALSYKFVEPSAPVESFPSRESYDNHVKENGIIE
jgi:hypothetical protein